MFPLTVSMHDSQKRGCGTVKASQETLETLFVLALFLPQHSLTEELGCIILGKKGQRTSLNLSPFVWLCCHCAEVSWPLSLCGAWSFTPGGRPGDQKHFFKLHIQGQTCGIEKPWPVCLFSWFLSFREKQKESVCTYTLTQRLSLEYRILHYTVITQCSLSSFLFKCARYYNGNRQTVVWIESLILYLL